MEKTPFVSVILPVKNEPYAKTLEYQINKHLGSNCEVLFQHEQGLSNAVWHGIKRAKGEAIVVMDADGSHSPNYILPMLFLLNNRNHVVVGYKQINHEAFFRRQTTKLFTLITRILLRLNLHDPLSGFIVGYKKCFNFKERSGFKFGLEVILANKEHIVEFPIVFEKRKSGHSKASALEGIRTLLQILKLSVEKRRILH